MNSENILHQLTIMSNNLGQPANDYVILGEGNSSARIDEESFWVKASGTEMRSIGPDGFVQVYVEPILAMLEQATLDDAGIKESLAAAKVNPQAKGHPSVETVLHALCLQLAGVNFVGHTHPTAINSLTCSIHFEETVSAPIFPDQVVVCGPAPVVVPYVDPGLPLARVVQERIQAYVDTYGERPRVIIMQNHGLVALGDTPRQVENITAMAVKAARVIAGTYTLGGPRFLSAQVVNRIHTRPDEHYRQRIIEQGGG